MTLFFSGSHRSFAAHSVSSRWCCKNRASYSDRIWLLHFREHLFSALYRATNWKFPKSFFLYWGPIHILSVCSRFWPFQSRSRTSILWAYGREKRAVLNLQDYTSLPAWTREMYKRRLPSRSIPGIKSAPPFIILLSLLHHALYLVISLLGA